MVSLSSMQLPRGITTAARSPGCIFPARSPKSHQTANHPSLLHTSSWTLPHATPSALERQLASLPSVPSASNGRAAIFTLHPDLDEIPHHLSILRAWAKHTRTELIGSFALPSSLHPSNTDVGKSISLATFTPDQDGERVKAFRSTLMGREQAQVGRWQRSSFLPPSSSSRGSEHPKAAGEENEHLAVSSMTTTVTGNSIRSASGGAGRSPQDESKGSQVGDLQRAKGNTSMAGDGDQGWENLWRTSEIFGNRSGEAGGVGGDGNGLVGLDGGDRS